jgi:hypothetical protein
MRKQRIIFYAHFLIQLKLFMLEKSTLTTYKCLELFFKLPITGILRVLVNF